MDTQAVVSTTANVAAEAICPNMSNAEFGQPALRLRDRCLELVERRLHRLRKWDPEEQSRAKQWFGASDEKTRRHLENGFASCLRVLRAMTEANFVRYSTKSMKLVGCTIDDRQSSGDVMAAACRPDTATHTIGINLGFCALREQSQMTDSQLSTLLHEVTHFNDTFASADIAYTMWSAQRLAKSSPSVAVSNADNLVGYVIHAQ